jgi:hypothetical protein
MPTTCFLRSSSILPMILSSWTLFTSFGAPWTRSDLQSSILLCPTTIRDSHLQLSKQSVSRDTNRVAFTTAHITREVVLGLLEPASTSNWAHCCDWQSKIHISNLLKYPKCDTNPNSAHNGAHITHEGVWAPCVHFLRLWALYVMFTTCSLCSSSILRTRSFSYPFTSFEASWTHPTSYWAYYWDRQSRDLHKGLSKQRVAQILIVSTMAHITREGMWVLCGQYSQLDPSIWVRRGRILAYEHTSLIHPTKCL